MRTRFSQKSFLRSRAAQIAGRSSLSDLLCCIIMSHPCMHISGAVVVSTFRALSSFGLGTGLGEVEAYFGHDSTREPGIARPCARKGLACGSLGGARMQRRSPFTLCTASTPWKCPWEVLDAVTYLTAWPFLPNHGCTYLVPSWFGRSVHVLALGVGVWIRKRISASTRSLELHARMSSKDRRARFG